MKNIKKAVVLLLSVVTILVVANTAFASTIQPRNTTENEVVNNTGNGTSGETENETGNTANNTTNNTANNTSNNATNNTSNRAVNSTLNTATPSPINTTNTTENIPNTGIENTYLNFALILLLAVVLGMFSLVQYNKISKKDE